MRVHRFLFALPLLLSSLSLAPHAAADSPLLAAVAPAADSSQFSCNPCRVGLQIGHYQTDQMPDELDVLPATVPAGYSADAFVAVHADRDLEFRWRGYKVAPSAFRGASPLGPVLSSDIFDQYGAETGLPVDRHDGAITPDMRF